MSAVMEIIKEQTEPLERRIAELEAFARAVRADCESTDPDDLIQQRSLINRIYADVCRVTR